VGPATSWLEGSRLGLSLEYGQTDTDVFFDVGSEESFEVQTAFATLSAALTDRWDFYFRLGAAQAETLGFDGGWDVSWGLGTRYTALQWGALSWGFLGQFTHMVSRFDTLGIFLVDGVETPLDATNELNLLEYAFATGPTWQYGPVRLYGGLLVRYLDGQFEIITESLSDRFDLDARWDAGGYIGGQLTLFRSHPARTYGFNRCDLTAEGRFSSDSTGFSVGLSLPFGGEY